MPDFWAGGPATLADVQRLARHLTGAEPLPPDLVARADVDRDGTISAADLWLLLRSSRGELDLPLLPPRIRGLVPAAVRSGETARIHGLHLDGSPSELKAVLRTPAGVVTAKVSPVSGTEAVLEVPPDAPAALDPPAVLQVLRNGVRSNGLTLVVGHGPVLHRVDPSTGAPGTTVRIHGAGFGAAGGGGSVRFGNLDAHLLDWTESLVSVEVPAITANVPVVLTASGAASNLLPFVTRSAVAGTVALPAGVPYSLSELRVECADGTRVPVAADGSFTLDVPVQPRMALELVRPDGATVLAALVRIPEAVTIDLTSSALWCLDWFLRPSLSPDGHAAWLGALPAEPAFTALIEALGTALPLHLTILDALTADSAVPAFGDALAAASRLADALLREELSE